MTEPSNQGRERSQSGDHEPDDEFGGMATESSKPAAAKMASHDPEKRRIRGLPILVLLGVVVLLSVAGWVAFGPAGIRPGMTRAEVDGRLGPPNGRMLAVGGAPIKEVVLVWKDRGLVIEFDEDDRVRKVALPPSFIGNLRSMFGF